MKVPLFLTGSQASKLWLEPVGRRGRRRDRVERHRRRRRLTCRTARRSRSSTRWRCPYRQKYGYPPPQFAQDGYSACLLLFEAIKKTASADRDKIRQALEHMTLVTPNGTFHYTPTDHSGLGPEFISVNVVRGGQLVPTDWAKERLAEAVASE